MGDSVDTDFCVLLFKIMNEGWTIQSRNEETKRLTGLTTEFRSTPLISIRKTAWKNALREMEWFLSGSNDINKLHPDVRHWWEPWASESGYIKNNYSKQFRRFSGSSKLVTTRVKGKPSIEDIWYTDQVAYLIKQLKDDPFSRRNVITTWNTHEMLDEETPITNCHGTTIQCFVDPQDRINMIMYQRSADMILGVPHNFIQYWAFLMYLAHQSGRKVGKFQWIGGDCHIYKPHFDLANEMITEEKNNAIRTPNLTYNPTSDEFKADDFTLDSVYKPIITKSAKMVV